jgi:hypothetical protein
MRPTFVGFGLAAALVALTPAALAQPSEDGFDKEADDSIAGKKQTDEEKKTGDKMPGEKINQPETPAGPDPNDPKEDPGKAYRFIGLRFRNLIVPKFMLNIFADGGTTVNAFTFGPEFTTRKDHIEFNIALSYADYSMDPFMFKGKDDGDEAFEKVSSTMKLLYLTFDILYEIPIDSKGRFAFLVGGGIGLAPVFGNLYRNQAYPDDPGNLDPDDPNSWEDCVAAGNPQVTQGLPAGKQYCDDANDHFVNKTKKANAKHSDQDTDVQYDEPSWFNGGSKPSIMPWISLPQISLRIKPIKQFQTRVDLGFSITGFFFGMNAGYALP